MGRLDPQVAGVLQRLPGIARERMTPEEARRASRDRANLLRGTVEPVAHVRDTIASTPAGEIPLRVYAPEIAAGRSVPGLVYFHGGGWVLSDLDGPDALCRTLASRVECVVVSVAYPLAPEHKFPAALEASHAATSWVAQNAAKLGVDADRIAVGGESAGGNLAATVALLARDRGGPRLAFQLLLVPVIDYAFDTRSYLENADGYGLTRAEMMWFWHHYLRAPVDGANPYASPLRAHDLGGVPPALVVTAEFDPLRDEGDAYAERLRRASVPVEHRRYAGVVHGFLAMTAEVDIARQAVDDIARSARNALSGAAATP
ncbi:MAG TPA: alpha/beta hydrolase [Candidatus Limnocylindria bacterium]|nr:alpha/beta hydrolase [Candidatus Limnocylindria bacterium]